jgi:hypothetical protein
MRIVTATKGVDVSEKTRIRVGGAAARGVGEEEEQVAVVGPGRVAGFLEPGFSSLVVSRGYLSL